MACFLHFFSLFFSFGFSSFVGLDSRRMEFFLFFWPASRIIHILYAVHCTLRCWFACCMPHVELWFIGLLIFIRFNVLTSGFSQPHTPPHRIASHRITSLPYVKPPWSLLPAPAPALAPLQARQATTHASASATSATPLPPRRQRRCFTT